VIRQKLIGCAIIAAAILWRVFTLDNYFPRLIGDSFYEWVLTLPFFSLSLSALVFLGLAFLGKIKPATEWAPFLASVLVWSFAGVGIAFIIIISLTIYHNSLHGTSVFISDSRHDVAVVI